MYLLRGTPLNRPWQGDIYKDIRIINDIILEYDAENNLEKASINDTVYTYAIILTQECDLEQDYLNRKTIYEDQYYRRTKVPEIKHDKYIPMILLAPAYLAESLKDGDHLKDEFKQKMEIYGGKNWNMILNNDNKRYHYLKTNVDLNIPDLIIDFKHYFTLSRDVFYEKYLNSSYLASITILFREELSFRFSNFISRIGIPNNARETELLTDSLRSNSPRSKDFSFELIQYWI
jgi:hypothetical protein